MAQKKILKPKIKKLKPNIQKSIFAFIDLIKKDNIPLKKVIVFGSQANGTAHKWSDIDICLISPSFKDQFEAMAYLIKKSYPLKEIIEPHPFHPKDFLNENPLVWEIKQNGIEIPLP